MELRTELKALGDVLDHFLQTQPAGRLWQPHAWCQVQTRRLGQHRASINPTSNPDEGSRRTRFELPNPESRKSSRA